SAGRRAFFRKLSVTNGDVALETANDHPVRSAVAGLIYCVRVRSPRAGYVPASGHVGWIILMTHSTRQIRAFAASAPAHTYASFLGCRRADLRGPQAVS